MSLFSVLATSKVAAGVLAAGAVAVGGTGVAAFNGVLPSDVQQSAHELLGAPAPAVDKAADAAAAAQAKAADAAEAGKATAADAVEAGKSKAAQAVANATSPEAFGLCTAFLKGGLKADSKVPGFESLVVAAGGDAKLEAHCEAVVEAGKAAGLKAEGSGNAAVDADASVSSKVPAVPAVPAVPSAPAVPAIPAVPAAPALPSQVPTDVPAVPGTGLDSGR